MFLCVLKVKRGQSEGQRDFGDERGGEIEGTGIFVTGKQKGLFDGSARWEGGGMAEGKAY